MDAYDQIVAYGLLVKALLVIHQESLDTVNEMRKVLEKDERVDVR